MRLLAPRPLDGLRLRLEVLWCRPRLDHALVEGAEPTADPALALRARQLTALPTRLAIARTLINILDAAQEPTRAFGRDGPRPPLQRRAVLAASEDLLALAERLRRPDDCPPSAAALAAQLVWDSGSPVYSANSDATVAEWARASLA